MADCDVPADVQRFLHDELESLEQLEILLLLQRRSGAAWSAQQVADELRVRDSVAEEALRFLQERGLLAVAVSSGDLLFRYQPVSSELEQMGALLARVYADQRVAVMKLMTANAIQRLRAGAVTAFSNSFLLGKREKPRG